MSDNVAPIKGEQGGISNDKIRHVAQTVNTCKADAKTYTDSANETVNDFGEDGGNKKAIRDAAKLAEMDHAKAQDYLRSLEHYCHVLGIYDQADMFTDAAE